MRSGISISRTVRHGGTRLLGYFTNNNGSHTLYQIFSKLLLTAPHSSTPGTCIACSAISDGFKTARLDLIRGTAYANGTVRGTNTITGLPGVTQSPLYEYPDWLIIFGETKLGGSVVHFMRRSGDARSCGHGMSSAL